MTNLTSIKQALAEATRGRWCQFHPSYCDEATGAPFSDWDTSHDMSAVEDGKRTKRIATFKHAADAAYVDAVQPVIMRDLLASHTSALAEKDEEIARLRELINRVAPAESSKSWLPTRLWQECRSALTDQQKG